MIIAKFIFLFITIFALNSCQIFSEKQQANINAPNNFKRLENKVLINEKSFNAHYINHDDILFLRDHSIDHDEIQIYLKTADKEQQLSHLKGHNFIYKAQLNDKKFLFLSDNQAEKYNLNRIQKSLESKVNKKSTSTGHQHFIPVLPEEFLQLNYDIYTRDIENYSFSRLTKKITPDLWPVQYNGSIYFSRIQNNFLQIFKMNSKNQKAYALTKKPVHHTLIDHKKHLTAWVEYTKDWSKSQIVVASGFNSKPNLMLSLGKVQSIDVHPTEQLALISTKLKTDQFELYLLNVTDKCLIRLSYLSSNELWPSWHPSGQKFIYTSDLNGSYQVYESQFFDSNACSPIDQTL